MGKGIGGRTLVARVRGRIERSLRPTLARLGYEPREEVLYRLGPVDLRGVVRDPSEALERAAGIRFVIDIPLERCRGHHAAAFACLPGCGHPYVETAVGLARGYVTGYADSPLARYYRHFRPATVAEYLGVAATSDRLRAHPATIFMPWAEPPAPGVEAQRAAALERENRAHGSRLGAEHGYHHFGPVSEAKGDLEIARLRSVLESIGRDGFRFLEGRHGLSRAQILTSGDDFVALISNGHHRTAALAALGHTSAPFWPLPTIVRREEVADWAAVRGGAITPEQALAVFDRIFAGHQPAALGAGYWQVFGPLESGWTRNAAE